MLTYCDLPDLGLLHCHGPEAGAFLHSQFTCDVKALGVGRATHGAYCTAKGRALATFLLWRAAPEGYYLQLPAALSDAIRRRLAMYVLRAKVKVEDTTGAWHAAGIAGDGAGSHVEAALGVAPASDLDVVLAPAAMAIRLGADRIEVLMARDGVATVREKLVAGATVVTPEHWNLLDVRAGVPAVTPATQEQFVPQMVNLDLIGALSYSKGCYPGQEIVARTHFLGRLKQRTYRIHLPEGEPRPGDRLYSAELGDQACGTIVNAAPAPEGGYEALACVQISSAAAGAVRWRSLEGPAASFLPLPYEVTSGG